MNILLLAAALLSTWGHLEKGPYAVGYKQLDRYDYARPYWMAADLDGKPRTIERARPMRVSVWYPAAASDAPFMTMGDYIDEMGVEDQMVASISDARKRAARVALFAFPVLRGATPEQRAKVNTLTTFAQRNAPVASGKFPLILYSLGSAALAAITPEYLASHGYVVMQMPRLGEFAGMPQDGATDTQSKVMDTDFLLQVAHEIPSADRNVIGAIGFSAGGRWALSEAMRNRDVRAVVSLDSVMLFNDAAGDDWRKLPFYDVNAVRVPLLHMIRRVWVPQQDAKMWESMRYADRTQIVFEDPKLDHFDFQSLGYVMTLAGMRPDAAPSVDEAFHRFNRLTLAFLDQHLGARTSRPQSPAVAAGDPFVTITHLAATPAPIQLADVMNAIAEGKTEQALKLAGKNIDIPEQTVNLAGYNLLGGGQFADAIRVFQLNVDAHPTSANAYDSLADAYLAAGDKEKAAELARRAEALLATDTTIPAARRQAIQESIRGKLK